MKFFRHGVLAFASAFAVLTWESSAAARWSADPVLPDMLSLSLAVLFLAICVGSSIIRSRRAR